MRRCGGSAKKNLNRKCQGKEKSLVPPPPHPLLKKKRVMLSSIISMRLILTVRLLWRNLSQPVAVLFLNHFLVSSRRSNPPALIPFGVMIWSQN